MSAQVHGAAGNQEPEVDQTIPLPPVIDKILEFDRQSLDDPLLNDDKIFIKLRECLRKFTVNADEAIKNMTTHLIPEYKF